MGHLLGFKGYNYIPRQFRPFYSFVVFARFFISPFLSVDLISNYQQPQRTILDIGRPRGPLNGEKSWCIQEPEVLTRALLIYSCWFIYVQTILYKQILINRMVSNANERKWFNLCQHNVSDGNFWEWFDYICFSKWMFNGCVRMVLDLCISCTFYNVKCKLDGLLYKHFDSWSTETNNSEKLFCPFHRVPYDDNNHLFTPVNDSIADSKIRMITLIFMFIC